MFPEPLHDFLFLKHIIKHPHAIKNPEETIIVSNIQLCQQMTSRSTSAMKECILL